MHDRPAELADSPDTVSRRHYDEEGELRDGLRILRGRQHIQNIAPTLVTRENMDTPEIRAKISPDLDKYLK